jgi:hypothetical protein
MEAVIGPDEVSCLLMLYPLTVTQEDIVPALQNMHKELKFKGDVIWLKTKYLSSFSPETVMNEGLGIVSDRRKRVDRGWKWRSGDGSERMVE